MNKVTCFTLFGLVLFATECFLPSMEIMPADNVADEGFVSIFDGRTLEGWRSVPADNLKDWSVRDGILVAKGSENKLVYLVYEDEQLADFELKLHYRMVTKGNSGVEIRGRADKSGKRPFEGYHADFGHVGIGPKVLGAWDFHFASREEYDCQRGTSLVIDPDGKTHRTQINGALTEDDLNKHDWNRLHIVARGNHLWFSINGKPASEFTDSKPERLTSGIIGLQIHDAEMVVEFKDILLKKFGTEPNQDIFSAKPIWSSGTGNSGGDGIARFIDFDKDGELDFVTSAPDPRRWVLYRNEGGQFAKKPFWESNETTDCDRIDVLDFNHDGWQDLTVMNDSPEFLDAVAMGDDP